MLHGARLRNLSSPGPAGRSSGPATSKHGTESFIQGLGFALYSHGRRRPPWARSSARLDGWRFVPRKSIWLLSDRPEAPTGTQETRWSGVRTCSSRQRTSKVPAGPLGRRLAQRPKEGRQKVTFNVLEHDLVPEHRLLSREEAEAILRALRITRDQLPKIKKGDPVIRILEDIEVRDGRGPIAEGRIVKITRLSPTAGVFEAYRMVVGR